MTTPRIDLHAHSTASDGTDEPAGLVAAAAEAGLDVLAITDHDTTDGWAEAAVEAQRRGVALVRGLEISTSYQGISIHLLAYLIDPDDGPLTAELDEAVSSRTTRLGRMVDRLVEGGLPISMAAVQAQTRPGATPGRPHIADALVAAGYCADRDEAFAGVLHGSGPYYVPHYTIDVLHAVRLVRAAGGVPVMAHPFASRRGRIVGDEVVEQMVEAGLAGIEARHRDHDDAEVQRALRLARAHDLIVTGSSDYHGEGKPNRLGENTTHPEALAAIEARATSRTMVLR